MAEIKSTMDIIMEKTNGLTMTEEEKKNLKQKELRGKFRGLLQKYLDGVKGLDSLTIEAASMGQGYEDMIKEVIIEESVLRITLGGNNEPILEVLEKTGNKESEPLRELLKDFELRLDKEKSAHETVLRKGLERKGISGSAIIPNLNADKEWAHLVAEMEERFQEKLQLLFDRSFMDSSIID